MGCSPLELSVVAPVFNEREGIARFVEETCQALDSLQREYELLCVDDGSDDGTGPALRLLATRFSRLRPLALAGHQGQSAALAVGIVAARGSLIALIDADLQNDPADIGPMLLRLDDAASPCDCVVGVRRVRRDAWIRRVSSRIANWSARWIVAEAISDAGCGLKLFRADVLKRIPLFRGAHRFLATLVRMEGGRVAEIDVCHRARTWGVSKYGAGLGRIGTALIDAFGVRWLKARRLRP
jgi:dolichol-phosphate mannosyltransferase